MDIYSFSPFGYEGELVKVEVDLRRGIPAIDMVGLPDGAVREARERMRAAIRNSGFEFPAERVLINLSPADVKKEGSGFDVPIALGVLSAARRDKPGAEDETGGGCPARNAAKALILGELELSGKIRPVRGVYAAVSSGADCGIRLFIVPQDNVPEARISDSIHVFGVSTLAEAFRCFSRLSSEPQDIPAAQSRRFPSPQPIEFAPVTPGEDYSDIRGQEFLIRALQTAAAGGHNILAFGPPGCGKTIALQRFPSLLPLLSEQEARSVTRIHSLAGLMPPSRTPVRTSPFRKPHQNTSLEGMTGGGPQCRPGEISLAHNGTLFLDEASEFRSAVLQSLRIPLETGQIRISRAGRSSCYPARFQLLLASNPCPCGNFGSEHGVCVCDARAVSHFRRKFSSPLLARIDIRVRVSQPRPGPLFTGSGISSAQLREAVARALAAEYARQGKKNCWLTPAETADFCALDTREQRLLEKHVSSRGLSGRACHSILKTARTIADMDASSSICEKHLAEAIQMRGSDIFFGEQ